MVSNCDKYRCFHCLTDFGIGLHLTPKGYEIVWEELSKVIQEKFPEYPPYKMPYATKVPWETARGDQMWDVNDS
jgi:hypothetical protein